MQEHKLLLVAMPSVKIFASLRTENYIKIQMIFTVPKVKRIAPKSLNFLSNLDSRYCKNKKAQIKKKNIFFKKSFMTYLIC